MSVHRMQRILVANRGEIARRIIRAAHDAGMEAVAVYAADDANAPHVAEADLALLLPGSSLADTYLNPAALTAAAKEAGADGLHPGYGFLSEDPRLPAACDAVGLVWVGPPAEAMRTMGHKARAKEIVSAAGVPILSSIVLESGGSAKALAAAGKTVGYPLLVKASAGGGGRGMRLVEGPDGLSDAVAAAQREAAAAFGSDDVFLERYLPSPRHIEVQVIADAHGTVLHLFDRECSVQRRHQKVIEEAPAILVDEATRADMWTAAITAAESVGYRGVGTVEFLVDGTDSYFLEMNTRLQVEHGVTELVTGLDLVGLQFLVAAGRPLPFAQADVVASGHAVEARLCAERPQEAYRPTPGIASHVRWPAGPGLRIDAAIESGSAVSATYDSLVAKVMAHAQDRATSIGRLRRALCDLELDGLETNRALLVAVLGDEVFTSGDAGINYLEQRPDLRDAAPSNEVRHRHAAAAAFALLHGRSQRSLVPVPAAGWRNVGLALHADELTDSVGTLHCRAPRPDLPASVQVGEEWRDVGTALAADDGTVVLDCQGTRRRYRVRLSTHEADVNGPEGQTTFALRAEDDPDEQLGTAGECRAPLPGTITKVLVAVGGTVTEGDGLVVLEAMKMEHTLRADGAGTVEKVLCAAGQQVDVGDLLVALVPE
ncbi:MAG TPA: biotin carboxylase N-terminal domain-containing protein [Acidimicrobiales bacterium]|nr:biotin carboxylase N-terminal domain-containing protein [Acidimicrobiales bacterium]